MLSQVEAIRDAVFKSAYEKCGSAHERHVATTVSLESILYTDPDANKNAIKEMDHRSNECFIRTGSLDCRYKGNLDKLSDKMCSELIAVIEKYTAELSDVSTNYTNTIGDICDRYYNAVVSKMKID